MAKQLTPALWQIAVSAAVGLPAIGAFCWSVFMWFQGIPDDAGVREIVREELARNRAVEHIETLTAQMDDMPEDDPKRDFNTSLIRDLCAAVQPPKPDACS
jgi:hypothetical protein